MDAKGANPFLMMGGEEEYESSPSSNMNPFLMDASAFAASEPPIFDNPFLSQAPAETSAAPSNNATNPFAFDPSDYGPPEATPAEVNSALPQQANDIFGNGMIAEPEPNIQTATTVDFFSMDNTEDVSNSCQMSVEPMVVQKPDALDLKHTNTVTRVEENIHMYSSDEEVAKTAALPKRPPPPSRPVVPPGTKELLMSVTGAMDATSSHLLDRIPPTRTPSPVSMRDLHSPSPTPEHAFADFLDVGNNKPSAPQNQEVDLFDLSDSNDIKPTNIQPVNPPSNADMMSLMSNDPVCDINQNHSVNLPQAPMKPPPPRPTPPAKPPPPVVRPNLPAMRPKPPLPPLPVVKPVQQNDDMMDMLGDSDLPPPEPKPVEKPVASTADIMSLYSTPVTVAKTEPQPVMDLLSESNEVSNAPSSAPESVISPEVSSQQDMHMDTSDTQSKGSASSVTFNPFAPEDAGVSPSVADTSPVITQDTNFQNNDIFSSQPETIAATNDIFSKPQEVSKTTSTDIFYSQPVTNTNTVDIFSAQTVITNANTADMFPAPPAVTDSNSGDIFSMQPSVTNITSNIFSAQKIPPTKDPFASQVTNTDSNTNVNVPNDAFFGQVNDEFDDFAAKFESAAKEDSKNGFDPFGGSGTATWGNVSDDQGFASGFEADEPFDTFLSLQEPPAVPQHTPSMLSKRESQESDEEKDFSVFIRPKTDDDGLSSDVVMPVLAPPPKSPLNAFSDNSPRLNPFDQQAETVAAVVDQVGAIPGHPFERTDSQETPPTPLFDDDVSQPLEDYPRVNWAGEGWEMQLRHPNKKKITGQRFWKKIFLKIIMHEDVPILQLFNTTADKDPFQELPLQPCYSVSDIGAQQYDNYGKIFTLKLQYIFYKERPGVRPGQVTKAERITNKLSQFAAYAIQGDYQGVKEFGSDLKKLGLPVEHAPQVSQLLKLGSLNYEDLKQFSVTIEEALFRLTAHRDRALHYKMEEVQVTAVDELYVEQSSEGFVEKQIARVRLFFLGFLSGMPDVELGVNDMRRQGKEVVGRHDIIPVVTEEWIRLEATEFHSCVQQDEYHKTHIIKFKPPDACYIELMRFRIRPPKNRELPLQLKPVMCITGNKVEIRADILVPGFASRKLGQVPCEDVQIRIPIPECWIYLFRVEKHFRYGSVKSAHRRTGKIKGIERFLGTVDTLQESLIEVTSGQAKYEHQHRAIVWRIPRLPKEGQGAYTTHNLVCRLALTSYDQVPDQLADYCYVEFTMPATQASHTTVRSVSLQNSQSDDPPEKYVRYLARHEYRVGIEHTEGEDPNAYAAATAVSRPAPVQEEPAPVAAAPEAESSSDSD